MAKKEETLLKEALSEGKVVIGTERTVEMLKQGKLKKVYLSSNCPAEVAEEIAHYSQISKTPVVRLNKPNEELGVFCKKPFSISVLGIR